jgi:hypothetical protein
MFMKYRLVLAVNGTSYAIGITGETRQLHTHAGVLMIKVTFPAVSKQYLGNGIA